MAENFVRSEFELLAEFTDATTGASKAVFRDIVAFSATFALNSIPVGTLVVAAGYDVYGRGPATIHSALKVLKPRDKVKVTLTVRSNDGDTQLMPSGTGVIFDGYYMGPGYQRSPTSVSYTLQLVHWLDDLNCSSMINGNWHPGVPHDLAQAANADVALMRGGSNWAGTTNAVPIVDSTNSIITKKNMEDDLWGAVLKPMFKEIATFSHPREQTYARDNNPLTAGNNAAALLALERMPGIAPKPATLPMFMDAVNAQAIADGANQGISAIAKDGMAYSSFWSKLIGEYAASFLFAVSPCPEFANVIPFFGGLRNFWKEIDGREYSYANFNSNVAHLIESIEIRYSQKSTSGWAGLGGRSPATSYYFPWGRFPQENTDLRGQIIIKDPPGWLANAIPRSMLAPLTTGLGRCLGCTCSAGGGPEETPAGVLRPADAEKNIADSTIVDKVCEHWYKTEILSQRYGELSGKLRFDIAPGSIVKIKQPDLSTDSEVVQYAAVTHVSFMVNAQQHTAGTSFTLLNLRTELENNNDLFTSQVPPLYPKSTWVGGPLVQGLS